VFISQGSERVKTATLGFKLNQHAPAAWPGPRLRLRRIGPLCSKHRKVVGATSLGSTERRTTRPRAAQHSYCPTPVCTQKTTASAWCPLVRDLARTERPALVLAPRSINSIFDPDTSFFNTPGPARVLAPLSPRLCSVGQLCYSGAGCSCAAGSGSKVGSCHGGAVGGDGYIGNEGDDEEKRDRNTPVLPKHACERCRRAPAC
jgi:hypothetical protein